MTTRVEVVPRLPPRARDAHKGSFGHVLCLAGSRQYSGAAVLTAQAALRGGAGLVTLGCPASIHPIVASHLVGEISRPLADTDGGFSVDAVAAALTLIGERDVVAIGPGVSRLPTAEVFVQRVVRGCTRPLVIDADGLNAFQDRAGELAGVRPPCVITPHPGEATRLLGRHGRGFDVNADREKAAVELAGRTRAIVVLKGAATLVTDGERLFENTTGNPGMATGGSGDVLTGLIAALLAQGLDAFDAAVLGVHAHGLAGDLAAADLGEVGLIATDILARLPHALRQLS